MARFPNAIHPLIALSMIAGLAISTDALAAGASSQPNCMAHILAPTHAIENPQAVMKAGSTWGPATQMRVNAKNGQVSLCAHGDYCYPATQIEFFTKCRIGAKPESKPDRNDPTWLYDLY